MAPRLLRPGVHTKENKKGENTMRLRYSAFTLVELTIVIAILAIMVAIGVPIYTDHSIRARVAESLEAAEAAKAAAIATRGDDSFAAGRAETAWPSEIEYIDSIVIDAAGNIRVATRDTGARLDPVMELHPTRVAGQPVAWDCKRIVGLSKHLPDECRN